MCAIAGLAEAGAMVCEYAHLSPLLQYPWRQNDMHGMLRVLNGCVFGRRDGSLCVPGVRGAAVDAVLASADNDSFEGGGAEGFCAGVCVCAGFCCCGGCCCCCCCVCAGSCDCAAGSCSV